MNLFLSRRPKSIGGGSNTFSSLFEKWANKQGHTVVRSAAQAEIAIVIAHLADEREMLDAKKKGCFIIHRLDEYFEKKEDETRREKHGKIISLNRFADHTVFQSEFVCRNVHPYLKPKRFSVIHNGGDQEVFHPAPVAGSFIGHVTWGVDKKKRLDLLREFIKAHPDEKFLLIGRHRDSGIDFKMPNVTLAGEIKRHKISRYYRMMKMLYFPSEKDPCPNAVIEAILCGVPVCYNPDGGTVELVKGLTGSGLFGNEKGDLVPSKPPHDVDESKICGLPITEAKEVLANLPHFRAHCFNRSDLYFDRVLDRYLALWWRNGLF